MLGRPWVVLREGERRRAGGDLRRHYLFEQLVRQTGGVDVNSWRPAAVTTALRAARGRRWRAWRRSALVASSELLGPEQLEAVQGNGVPTAVDIHDEPLAQNQALGIETQSGDAIRLRRLLYDNLEAFRWHVAPSASFVVLAGLDPARTLVASNGCDPRHVTPVADPAIPRLGFLSGAAPGRGIEALIDAARLARSEIPGLELCLWLVATGDASQAYLDALSASLVVDRWITVGPAPYATLGNTLGSASVLVVPHPANAYMDAAVPVKLFDSMAAGRPVVVTPRTEMAAIVERWEAGLVAAGDEAADLAEPIVRLLRDPDLRHQLGSNARVAAEREFDWAVIGARLADELLARTRRWYRPTRGSAPAGGEAHR